MTEFTSGQLKAARGLLGLKQDEMAAKCGLPIATLKRLESDAPISSRPRTYDKVTAAIEAAGIEFIEDDGERGAGVRLRVSTQGGTQ